MAWPFGKICWLFGPVVAEILKFSHVVFDDPVNVTVSFNKTAFCQFWKVLQIFEGFKMEIPGAIQGMFGVQMAPLEVPRVPSPSFYTLLFSSSLYFAPPSTLYMLCFSLFELCTSPALLKHC